MGAATEMTEFERLRLSTTGDLVSAGLAVAEMEPHLEKLFDQLHKAQDLADQLQGMHDEHGELQNDASEIARMIAEAMEGGNQEQQEDGEKQQDRINEALQKLEQQMQEKRQELDGSLRDAAPQIAEHIREAMADAQDQAESLDNMSTAWGLEPGSIQRLPAHRRVELAKKMNNDKMRRLAKLIGPMQRLAMSEQARKTIFAREEVYDVTLGSDITRTLPTELMMLTDEDAELEFFRKYVEGSLMQYELRGTEKVSRGDIIFCEDGSGSMGGDREVWAKAVGLALMQISIKQGRGFTGIHFGSPGEHVTFDFDKQGGAYVYGTGCQRYGSDMTDFEASYYEPIDAVMFFAELFFNSGTDFHTPLNLSLDMLRKQHADFGGVKGDIVFVTDGQCQVDEKWFKEFKSEQERLGFKVWGIIIDGMPQSEPLNSICDGRVLGITELLDGSEVSEIFREI